MESRNSNFASGRAVPSQQNYLLQGALSTHVGLYFARFVHIQIFQIKRTHLGPKRYTLNAAGKGLTAERSQPPIWNQKCHYLSILYVAKTVLVRAWRCQLTFMAPAVSVIDRTDTCWIFGQPGNLGSAPSLNKC